MLSNVEPETERKGNSCASARNVTAGVVVSHSGQGNEASKLDGDRRVNASFVLFPVCNLAVIGSSGWAMGRMFTR